MDSHDDLRRRVVLVIELTLGCELPASAALGASAVRGDNCTPFNSFKVGYAVPGRTIVSQSVVLVGGWAVAGWLLDTASRSYYVPNPWFFDRSLNVRPAPAPPPFEELPTAGEGFERRVYTSARTPERILASRAARFRSSSL